MARATSISHWAYRSVHSRVWARAAWSKWNEAAIRAVDFAGGVDDVDEQASDIAPTPVDRGAVHSGPRRDTLHRESLVTVFSEFGAHRVENLGADAGGATARPAAMALWPSGARRPGAVAAGSRPR
jgi:hypothetical protein